MTGRLATLVALEWRQVGVTKLAAIGCMLGVLAFLPFGVRIAAPEPTQVPAEVFWPFVFVMMLNFVFLQTMVILIPLLFATSLIRNEVEEGTVVYLVTRPIPRPLLVLAKYVAVTALAAGLIVAGMVLFEVAFLLPGGDPTDGTFAWFRTLIDFCLAGVLGAIGYGALFTLVGIVFRRGMIWGIAYGFISELILTNIPAVVREVTIMHYLRSVALAHYDLTAMAPDAAAEDLNEAKEVLGLLALATPGDAALTVLLVAAICLGISALIVRSRELTAVRQGED